MCLTPRWRAWNRQDRTRGSATVMMVAVIGAVVAAIASLTWVIGQYVAQSQAQIAADLGALAGASAAQRGGDACTAAGSVVVANSGRLLSCRQVAADVYVTAGVASRTADARAGPVRQ